MKSFWKAPPRAKVYEALSALGDDRITMKSDTTAEVTSSSGDKKYHVEWSSDRTAIASNDNASYYQGYMGYPILAVLLKLGVLSYDSAVAGMLSGIPWKRLNTKHKRNYDKAVEEALTPLEHRELIEKDVTAIYDQVIALRLERGPTRWPPPSGR